MQYGVLMTMAQLYKCHDLFIYLLTVHILHISYVIFIY